MELRHINYKTYRLISRNWYNYIKGNVVCGKTGIFFFNQRDYSIDDVKTG